MHEVFSKLLRSVQVKVPRAQPLKERGMSAILTTLRRPHEADFLALKQLVLPPRARVVDVGANTGQSLRSIQLLLPGARITAFEASPVLAAELSRAFKDVDVRAVALGDEETELSLFVPSYGRWVFHGLASTDRSEAADWLRTRLFRYREAKLHLAETAVLVRMLDDELQGSIGLIKVDTQGTELSVLRGARGHLEKSRPAILVEYGRQYAAIWEYLQRFGYRAFMFDKRSGLTPVDDYPTTLNCWFLVPEQHLSTGTP